MPTQRRNGTHRVAWIQEHLTVMGVPTFPQHAAGLVLSWTDAPLSATAKRKLAGNVIGRHSVDVQYEPTKVGYQGFVSIIGL